MTDVDDHTLFESLTMRAVTTEGLVEVARLFVSVFTAEPWTEQWIEEDALRSMKSLRATDGFAGFAKNLVADGPGLPS